MFVLIYIVVMPLISICTEHSLAADYTVADVLVVHTQILYYTCNNDYDEDQYKILKVRQDNTMKNNDDSE